MTKYLSAAITLLWAILTLHEAEIFFNQLIRPFLSDLYEFELNDHLLYFHLSIFRSIVVKKVWSSRKNVFSKRFFKSSSGNFLKKIQRCVFTFDKLIYRMFTFCLYDTKQQGFTTHLGPLKNCRQNLSYTSAREH